MDLGKALPPFLLLGVPGVGLGSALTSYRRFGYTVVRGLPFDGVASLLSSLSQANSPVIVCPQLGVNTGGILPEQVLALKKAVPDLNILALDATEAVIMHRRMANDSPLVEEPTELGLDEAVRQEKTIMALLIPLADYVIETSNLDVAEFKAKIAKLLGLPQENQPLTLFITSFGFKYGVPHDAEMVFDMRYMKNPFYDESLRPLTGLDQPVKDFIMAVPEAASAQQRWLDWLHELIPQFIAQGRTRLSVAIGCTGGKHRSVFMAETLAESLARQFPSLRLVVRHREEPRWAARPLTAVSGTSSGQYKDTMHHG